MLDVSDNKITAIPDCIGELKMLERLDAYANNITSLNYKRYTAIIHALPGIKFSFISNIDLY